MAITDKLKSLYTKLGGDANTSASNIEEWVNKIEEVAGSGSGSGIQIYEMTQNSNLKNVLQVPAKELYDLAKAGNIIFFRMDHDTGCMSDRLIYAMDVSNMEYGDDPTIKYVFQAQTLYIAHSDDEYPVQQ